MIFLPIFHLSAASNSSETSLSLNSRNTFELRLEPFVQIGVKSVRSGPRHDPPEGYRVACPSEPGFCIDYQTSDNGTCMHPDPVEVKKCYDNSCIQSPWGPDVRRRQNEDTYCKDFMTPQGRLCQWIDDVPCTCESKSIIYYSGEFVAPGDPIPPGFTEAAPCTYPLDLIRRAAEEAAIKAREKKNKNRGTRRPGKRNRERLADSPEDPSRSEEAAEGQSRQRLESATSGSFQTRRLTDLFILGIVMMSVFMS